jgi:UDP:flavonoid glycosyltransferase YjiC (YdhE family)
MKIIIISLGSRGDFQPFIALGKKLMDAGHTVTIPAPPVYKDLVVKHGLKYVALNSINPHDFMSRKDWQKEIRKDRNIHFLNSMLREAKGQFKDFLNEIWKLCQSSELIIGNVVFFGAWDCAEKIGIPFIQVLLTPVYPTKEFNTPAMKPTSLRIGSYNYLTHILFYLLLWFPFHKIVNNWRRHTLNLPPYPFWGPFRKLRRSKVVILSAYSPSVVPPPRDWPSNHIITGYWFLDEDADWKPSPALQSFLQNGPRPVYIGFGSMESGNKPGDNLTLIKEALKTSGQRGILLSEQGTKQGTMLSENLFCISDIPHSWLFTKVKVVVHHGGAGTTASCLRAGVPSIIVPFLGDQFFWGHRIEKIGAGLLAVSYYKLTAQKLSQLIIKAVTDESITIKAQLISRSIKKEKGLEKAVSIINQIHQPKKQSAI